MRELANHLERMAQINRDIREAAATAIAYCDWLMAYAPISTSNATNC